MITTYRYTSQTISEHDGKKKVVGIPSKVVLAKSGPFIEPVTITHPNSVKEQLEKEGKSVPAKTVRALIDTGASFSIITPKIADELGLVHTGYQDVTSV
ncbi:aspartyl protease family protein [Candidatus Poribacteria bacterium]